MKKILFVGITALAMASCTHDDYAPVSKQEQYQAVFEKEFGAVNPNVNWGFTPQQVFTFDKDGKLIGTRGSDPNANDWYKYLTVPAPLTDAQKEVVRKWFQNNPNPKGLEVNWSDFFVQQVYKGGTNTEGSKSLETYDILKEDDTPTGSKVTGSNQMDWLHCGNNSNVGEHINNFNNGNASETNVGEGNNKFHKDRIMYMKDYNTTCFGFHDSYGQTYYDNSYVLIPGDIIDPIVAGMYFVGFDYQMQKYDNGEIRVKPDGYYSDWIVRIAPGLNAPGTAAMRVMVEDIIDSNLTSVTSSDWDFNDAVFDVKFEDVTIPGTQETNWQNHNQRQAVITLHAAGGTKYLTIGGEGDKGVEVHKALCVEQSTMVNTVKDQGVTRPVAIFRIPVADNVNNANDIPVYVGSQILEAKQGKATQKFCVPTDVRWMQERQQVRKTYKEFKDYVENAVPEEWYKIVKGDKNDFRY